jgi:hypothetical protein
METPSRDHTGVGEPEVEEIAVDEEAVAQAGHGFQKRQQPLLHGGRRHAEVGVGNDDEGMAEHGAKDGSLRRRPQPAEEAVTFPAS